MAEWSKAVWFGFWGLMAITEGWWIVLVLMRHMPQITGFEYYCNQCDAKLKPDQLRPTTAQEPVEPVINGMQTGLYKQEYVVAHKVQRPASRPSDQKRLNPNQPAQII